MYDKINDEWLKQTGEGYLYLKYIDDFLKNTLPSIKHTKNIISNFMENIVVKTYINT